MATSPARAPQAHQPRSGVAFLGDGLLTLAAIGGVLCIFATIATLLFSVSFIMFRTGSMGPAIPAGSLAFVQKIPASEVDVGDVVTVDRVGRLPVSHRVVASNPIPDTPEVRALTLRGDANEYNDPSPYEVSDVRLVLFSLPGFAVVMGVVTNPFMLGSLTVALVALVIRLFWPAK